jgi:hypothetical protein
MPSDDNRWVNAQRIEGLWWDGALDAEGEAWLRYWLATAFLSSP